MKLFTSFYIGMRRVGSLEKTDAGRDWGTEEKGMTEDEMAGWHHWLHGRESEWTPGDGDGQGGLACCDSWGRKELDTTERLNWTELIPLLAEFPLFVTYFPCPFPLSEITIVLQGSGTNTRTDIYLVPSVCQACAICVTKSVARYPGFCPLPWYNF